MLPLSNTAIHHTRYSSISCQLVHICSTLCGQVMASAIPS